MQIGVIGSGSWATAIAKILTDNNQNIYWWFRNPENIEQVRRNGINPHYLSKTIFNTEQLMLSDNIQEVFAQCSILIIVVPSAYVVESLNGLDKESFKNKKIISAVKGILPGSNELLIDYLIREFNMDKENYFTLLGPCHAEEVAAEKLSYLTFSGTDAEHTENIANLFTNKYINTRINTDLYGVQYAAVLKNIYALAAGIATGLDYGDNFLSVFIANCTNEMEHFLDRVSPRESEHKYSVSVYLGDLLVTCYSLYSRNRMFGTMIGKGYSVKATKLELNMEAEGYNASKCIYDINKEVKSNIPIAETVYEILWNKASSREKFRLLEKILK